MDGLFFDIKRFAVHDGTGIRTTFFMQGCPMACPWCHNPESRLLQDAGDSSVFSTFRLTTDQLLKEAAKDQPFYEESGGGITFSGGEPTMQIAFLKNAAKMLKSEGLHLTLDTAGYFPEKEAAQLAGLFDVILLDIKHTDDRMHKQYTGVSNKRILKNMETMINSGARLRLRFPYIPGFNDNDENMENVAALAAEKNLPLDILPCHGTAQHKYQKLGILNKMHTFSEPARETLEQVRSFYETRNIRVKIGG